MKITYVQRRHARCEQSDSLGRLRSRGSSTGLPITTVGLWIWFARFMKNQTSVAILVFFLSLGRIEVNVVNAGCWRVDATAGGVKGPVSVKRTVVADV
jgi:hypothetical protein